MIEAFNPAKYYLFNHELEHGIFKAREVVFTPRYFTIFHTQCAGWFDESKQIEALEQ